jgi:hypothetical protein
VSSERGASGRTIGGVHARIVAGAVSVLVLPFGVLAQSAFDVASVKPNTTGHSA